MQHNGGVASNPYLLDRRVAAVTGPSRAMAVAVGGRLLERHARVALCTPWPLDSWDGGMRSLVSRFPSRISVHQADLAAAIGWDRFLDEVEHTHGAVDVIVAGGPLPGADDHGLPNGLIARVAPRPAPAIACVSACCSGARHPDASASCRVRLERLVEHLAGEARSTGVRVNGVDAGLMAGPVGWSREDGDSLADGGLVAVADLVAFLVSPAARAVAGQVLTAAPGPG